MTAPRRRGESILFAFSMADEEPQRQGWFSWLRQSIWSPCEPERVDVNDGRGKFFPFLGPSSSAAGTGRQPPRGLAPDARTIRESITSDGTAAVDDERPPSPRVTGKEETQLKRQIPAIWKYLREEEGWSFANPHGWDVRGPPTGPAASGNAESGVSTQQRVGPMPQGQVCRGSSFGESHYVYLRCTNGYVGGGHLEDTAELSRVHLKAVCMPLRVSHTRASWRLDLRPLSYGGSQAGGIP